MKVGLAVSASVADGCRVNVGVQVCGKGITGNSAGDWVTGRIAAILVGVAEITAKLIANRHTQINASRPTNPEIIHNHELAFFFGFVVELDPSV